MEKCSEASEERRVELGECGFGPMKCISYIRLGLVTWPNDAVYPVQLRIMSEKEDIEADRPGEKRHTRK